MTEAPWVAYGESWVLVACERAYVAADFHCIQACSGLCARLRTQPLWSAWDVGGGGTLSTISDFVSLGGKGSGEEETSSLANDSAEQSAF